MEPAIFLTTIIFMDLEVFKTLSDSKEPQSTKQLEITSGADVRLLERLLKSIAAENFGQETGADEYAANELTQEIATPGSKGIMR